MAFSVAGAVFASGVCTIHHTNKIIQTLQHMKRTDYLSIYLRRCTVPIAIAASHRFAMRLQCVWFSTPTNVHNGPARLTIFFALTHTHTFILYVSLVITACIFFVTEYEYLCGHMYAQLWWAAAACTQYFLLTFACLHYHVSENSTLNSAPSYMHADANMKMHSHFVYSFSRCVFRVRDLTTTIQIVHIRLQAKLT